MSHAFANRRGILALCAGMAAFAVNDTFVKLAGRTLPFGEVMFLRGTVTLILLGAALAVTRALSRLPAATTPVTVVRALFDGLGAVCFVSALIHMKIADVAAIALTAPLIMTALAVAFYGETVGWRRWAAVVTGLVGTLFIVKPASSAFDLWAIVPLGAAIGGASRDLLTRRVQPSIPSLAISFIASVAVTLSGLVVGLSESWRVPAGHEFALIAVSGLFLGFGTFFLVLAFRDVEISVVAPFRYTLLIWIGIAGYIAFGEVPDGWSLFGAALIVGSGLYTLHREAVRRRYLTARAAPPG